MQTKTKIVTKIEDVRIDNRIFDIQAPEWVSHGDIAAFLVGVTIREKLRLMVGHTLRFSVFSESGYFEIEFVRKDSSYA